MRGVGMARIREILHREFKEMLEEGKQISKLCFSPFILCIYLLYIKPNNCL
jgi:hypothetical protein